MNRRHFLMSTAIMAGNAAVRGMQSPNDTVRVGIAGLGGRGGNPCGGVGRDEQCGDRRPVRRG